MTEPVEKDPESSSGKRPVDTDRGSPPASVALDGDFPIVGVGASAGGLEAFTRLLKHLPSDSGMAFVFIQHLDPNHPSLLCEALGKVTEMSVRQPEDRTPVEPNHVYVIPPDADISLERGLFSLVPRTPDGPRPHLPIDFFLRSLAADRGSHAIGVVLSGNASDGTEGLRAVKTENGITFAQDPESAKIAEMPRNAINAGVVDYTLAPPELAKELVRLSLHPYVAAREPPRSIGDAPLVNRILGVVRNAIGVDFTEYKGRTFNRRLARRMALRRADRLDDYLAILQREPEEIRSLYEDILIHVTSFFRDREVFQALESRILPAILKQKSPDAPIRIWVAGCATGEEVYSIAISLLELLAGSSRPVQIFGSDLSEATIAKARAGVYADGALGDMSDERR
jgi:two-component system CheB/CheR fusion protein